MTAQKSVPKHIGFILDGNRRWAKKNGLPQLEGHKRGYENLKIVGQAALETGVQYISAYVFSTENWKRSKREVNYLLKLLSWVVSEEIEEFHKQNIRVRVAGTRNGLSTKIVQQITDAEELTINNNRGTLVLCLNYGGQQEIIDAVNNKIIKDPNKPISLEDINQELYVADVPPVDLIIRTSGEQRLSNFMLWRAAYSELMFVDEYWPDLTAEILQECLSNYAKRQRRFGS